MDMKGKGCGFGIFWRDESGMAMILALSLTALLTLLGMFLIVESGTTFRMTQSLTRYEQTFNLAEAGLQLSHRCLVEQSNEWLLGSTTPGTLTVDVSYMEAAQPAGNGNLTPQIDFIDSRPVPGWDVSKFMGYYYLARGQGAVPMPGIRGDAQKEVMSLFQKMGQVRPR